MKVDNIVNEIKIIFNKLEINFLIDFKHFHTDFNEFLVFFAYLLMKKHLKKCSRFLFRRRIYKVVLFAITN